VKHQSFVGTGYFDEVAQVLSGGLTSTLALEGSTEAAQFTPEKAREKTAAGKPGGGSKVSSPI